MKLKKEYLFIIAAVVVGILIYSSTSERTATTVSADGYKMYFNMENLRDSVSGSYGKIVKTGVTTVPGAIGNAYSFSRTGGGGYIQFPQTANTTLMPNMQLMSYTIEFWVKPAKLEHSYIVHRNNNFLVQMYYYNNVWKLRSGIYWQNSTGIWHANMAGVPVTNASLNRWMHVVLTYNNTIRRSEAYLNGEHLTTETVTNNVGMTSQAANNNIITIGGREDTTVGDRSFTGIIDEMKIYNKVLTLSQIRSHYLGCTAGATECTTDKAAVRTCVADTTVGGNKWSQTSCVSPSSCTVTNNVASCTTTTICTAGTKRCKTNSVVETCNSAGTAWVESTCTGTTPVCSNGACIAAPCSPKTCSAQGINCGPASNGCGGTIQCGSCATGTMCTMGKCTDVVDCTTDADCNDADQCQAGECTAGMCSYYSVDNCTFVKPPYAEKDPVDSTPELCPAYMERVNGECKTSLSYLFTRDGLAEYYEQNTVVSWIVIALAIFGVYSLSKKGKGRRK